MRRIKYRRLVMFFTWTGKGYMVPLSAALSTLGMMGVTSATGLELSDEVLGATAAVISGAFIWKLHHWLEARRPSLSIVDDETGASASIQIRHDFYWIPLKYWGIIFVVGGIVVAVNAEHPGIFGF
ncbi:MAG: hypothetical protein RLN69_11960 [Woeseiaceae bacterium]